MIIPKTEYVVLEPGFYPATVRSIEVSPAGQYGPQLQWLFDIVGADPNSNGQKAWSSTTMTEANKTGRWVKAILGEIPEELDTNNLIGRACRLSLTVKMSTKGTEVNQVAEVLSPKATKATNKPRPEPEPAEEEKEETPF